MTAVHDRSQGIGIAEFKAAMRALPAQICIIAARAGGTRIAMTATAVTSLSAEPPQLLVCIHRQARPAAILREAGAFSVNLVPLGLVGVATQCALPGLEPEQRFELGSWSDSAHLNQPMLDGALAAMECRLVSAAEHGTHYIFVGHIEQLRLGEGEPLLYHDASYREIGRRLDERHLEWDSAIRGF